MDRKNNNDSSERVIILTLSVMIVFYLFIAGIITGWTKNEEHNNSQRSISSMYSSFVEQPEEREKEK